MILLVKVTNKWCTLWEYVGRLGGDDGFKSFDDGFFGSIGVLSGWATLRIAMQSDIDTKDRLSHLRITFHAILVILTVVAYIVAPQQDQELAAAAGILAFGLMLSQINPYR